MKVGILTFHRAMNFGAAIQAAALRNYISDNISECEIIDYIPNNSLPSKSPVHKALHYVKAAVFLKRTVKYNTVAKKFESFRGKYMNVSGETYYGDTDIKSRKTDYGILVSGSDQILNTSLTGESRAFYLDFCDDLPKISYASSFGRDNITDTEKELIKSELPKFRAISCREESGIEIIERECGKKAELVADPVFLWDKAKYDEISGEKRVVTGKYILSYMMEENSGIIDLCEKLSEETGLPVYVITGSKIEHFYGRRLEMLGPEEFLNVIKNAETVITNSFHGSAFSVIFGKKLYCFAHSERNTRLKGIMKLTGNEEKLIYPGSLKREYVDGEKAYERIKPVIESSKRFLSENIKG